MQSLADSAGRLRDQAGAAAGTVLDLAFWAGIVTRLIHVAVIVALALGVLFLVRRLKKRMIARVEALPTLDPRRQRTVTVADLLGSTARYAIWGVAAIMALAELGLDIGPLLAGAGVAGLAVGFGAQTLVKDVISGVFLLFDQSIHIGDLVTIGGETGTVEYIGLRLIKVRKFDGELLMIPAGELRTFGNKSVGYARAIVDVELAYDQDVDAVMETLDELTTDWADDEENKKMILEEKPEVQAMLAMGGHGIKVRIVVQVVPGEQSHAERSLRRLIKRRFDERQIKLTTPATPAA